MGVGGKRLDIHLNCLFAEDLNEEVFVGVSTKRYFLVMWLKINAGCNK